MKLLIDAGNTAVKIAFKNDKGRDFYSRFYLSELSLETLKLHIGKFKEFEEIVISSVVPSKNHIFDEYFDSYQIKPKYVKVGDYPEIKIEIDNPSELGVDLYCDLVGAYQLYSNSNSPVIIIDLGTASKLLLLERNGVFKSCAIVPGIEISKKSLSSSAALLPEINQIEVKDLTKAKNTEEVIASSVYWAHVETINGLISRFEKEIGEKCQYIVTGGNAVKIVKDLKAPHIYDEHLAFKGMWAITNRG